MPHRERKYISAALILLAACFFFTPQGWLASLRAHFTSALAPIEQPVRTGINAAGNFFSRVPYLWSAKEENTELSSKVKDLLAENKSLEEENLTLRNRLARLEEHVRQYPELRKKRLLAQITYRDTYHLRAEIRINRGANDGIEIDCAVLAGRAVVGRVIEVGARTSKVRLLIDPRCSVSVKIKGEVASGMVSGKGFKFTNLKLDYYDRRKEIKEGDSVFTTGFDGRFEKNMIVGEVIKVVEKTNALFPEITVKPSADFAHLTEVIILLPDSGE